MALPGDATDLDSQRSAMETFANETGGIDAAFANAGMGLSAAGTVTRVAERVGRAPELPND